jgi:hypothetical protein
MEITSAWETSKAAREPMLLLLLLCLPTHVLSVVVPLPHLQPVRQQCGVLARQHLVIKQHRVGLCNVPEDLLRLFLLAFLSSNVQQ